MTGGESPDSEPSAERRPRVWVVGSERVTAALAAATDRVRPVAVDPAAPPTGTPAAAVLVDVDPSVLDDRFAAVPRAVVGRDVDAAAAYGAGADAVVPVDPTADPAPVVAWLERTAGHDEARARELRRYEAVLETARGMVFVVDEDRRFSLVTDPLADRLGYDRADLVGRHVSALLDEDAVETTGAIREALLASEDGGERASRTFEVAVRAADGERVPLEVELTPFDTGVERGTVGVVTDRSALRAARATLATERDRLTELFESLPNPAVEYEVDPSDGEAVVRSVNPAFCEAFGVDRAAAVGAPLSAVLPDYDPDDGPERLVGAAPGETVTAEVDHDADGDRRRFRFSGVSFRADDRVRAFGVYTDVTDARRRERYFRVVARVLRHNLRNELNVLLSHADRIRAESPDGSVAAETAERVAGVVDDLAALSEDAHDLARVVEGEGPASRTTVDLAALGRSAAAAAAGPVETDLPDALGAVADPRVDRALAEVVENALEHAPDAGPRIEAVADGDWVGLRVVDDGPGIPETERAVVAGEREITQTDHASGLGLWLARWLVEDAGGRLAFESPESGTSVALWFPRA